MTDQEFVLSVYPNAVLSDWCQWGFLVQYDSETESYCYALGEIEFTEEMAWKSAKDGINYRMLRKLES